MDVSFSNTGELQIVTNNHLSDEKRDLVAMVYPFVSLQQILVGP
jgi:hypothetical protein